MERGEREFMKQQGVKKWGNRKKESKKAREGYTEKGKKLQQQHDKKAQFKNKDELSDL